MANWTGKARTNYIQVKDVDALKAAAEQFNIEVNEHPTMARFVSFESGMGDSGDFEHTFTNDDDVEVEWDWTDLCSHFAEGQVLIVMTVGGERTRYLTGIAQAVAWDGRVTSINLNDIYKKAAEEFSIDIGRIGRAEY